jgi:hypothetical protein
MDPRPRFVELQCVVDGVPDSWDVDYPVHDQVFGNNDPPRRHCPIMPTFAVMVRRAVFDPTDRELFLEQRQRFDWSLLHNGHVFRYDCNSAPGWSCS